MKKYLIIYLLAACSVFAAEIELIDLSAYDTLPPEQKVKLFDLPAKIQLRNKMEFMELLILGIGDPDAKVRSLAVPRTALALLGLQDRIQKGQPISINPETMAQLTTGLMVRLDDSNPDVRSSAGIALAASGAPSSAMEATLIQAFRAEQNSELKGNLIEAMVNAGYNTPTFRTLIVERAANAVDRELDCVAQASARLRITEALPVLLKRMDEKEMPDVILIRSLGEFGDAATIARPKLERLAAETSGFHLKEVQEALDAISRKTTERQPIPAFRDLTGKTSSVDKNLTNSSHTADSFDAKSSKENESQTTTKTWLLAIVMVAIMGCLGWRLKRRA